MAKAKVASLSGSVIATKGTAAPSSDIKTIGEGERIAVTVRLSPTDYRNLKLHGVEHRESNQDIIVAALSAYLSNDVNKQ
jgi:hypothetical protein